MKELILNLTSRELKYIELLGGVLGEMIGLLQSSYNKISVMG